MPITIIERPEVFTEASLLSSDPPLLIPSKAVGLLTHELRRYCKREISGRSFLIAGHRGAGKTTLVLNGCQEILKESEDGRVPLRPLLVMLQGPNLLPNEEDELPIAEDGDKTKVAQKKISPMENVLRQITLGLYRALAREISQAFRRYAVDLVSSPELTPGVLPGELIEFAATLELELDEYPGKGRLRQFWQRAGALETGVLWARPRGTGGVPSSTVLVRPPGQGFRELVALCSACEAYRRISGTFTSKQEDKQSAKAADERKIEADLKGKELLGPILPVLVGALAGTGVWATELATGLQAALAGTFAAIASAFVFKYATSRSRERSATREDLFIPDLSVATLDRVLPVLIDRLHAASLAPVFVIDELDKVERLSIRIPEMVRRLKKLVAENAFFCFLTDRTYYEEMRERELKKPYSIEHTYFTHQVFIIFRHQDLHGFLEDVLQPPHALPEPAQPSGLAPAIVSPTDREVQNLIKLERDDCEVLPYLLLYAARMHSIDLRRELVLIRGENGKVTLTAGAVQAGRRYGLELQMQVAIEILLDEEDMERELDRHPEFRRLAHDALYYLAERWEDADDKLDLYSKDALAKFKEYLCSRMATDPPDRDEPNNVSWHYVKVNSQASKKRAVQTTDADLKPPAITDSDLDFLWARVRDLAALLSSHEMLLARARLRGAQTGTAAIGTVPPSNVLPRALSPFPEVVLKAISLDPLLSRLEGNGHHYRWCWYPAGRRINVPVPGAARGQEKKVPSWRQHVEFIRAFSKELSSLTKGGVTFADLGTNLNIISTSPPWKIVEDAMNRLETLASKGSYGGQDEDSDTVGKFDALLKRSAATIAYAICAARVLKLRTKSKTVADMAQPLTTISSGLSLRSASEASVAEWMKELFRQFRSRFSADELPTPPPIADINGIERWTKWVSNQRVRAGGALRRGALKDLPDIRKRAWDHWYARLTGRDFAPVNLDSLICTQHGIGPGPYLTLPVEEMTVQKWSGAFCGALNFDPRGDTMERPPMWLALAALSHLGFADRLAPLRERGSGGDGLFQSEELSNEWRDAILSWPLDFAASPPKRAALVLRRAEPALVGTWKPDLAFPILTLSRPQADAVRVAERLGDLKGILSPEMVIFDLTATPLIQVEGTAAKPSELQLPPDELEKVFLSAVVPMRVLALGIPIVLPADLSPPPVGYLCIINPKNSEELFRPLTQQDEVAARHLPPAAAQ